MIEAIDFPERNSFFYKWEHDNIAFTVPAYQDGRHIITCWQFSSEDLQLLFESKGKCYIFLNSHHDLATLAVTLKPPFRDAFVTCNTNFNNG